MPSDILRQLIESYLVQGWPFALAHGLVLLLVIWSFVDFLKETRGLARWTPPTPADKGGTQAASGKCSVVLTEFCLENAKLAPAGMLVPLTDFTDRMDSIVEGMVGRLHDLTNLFLVVGIAGTIWSFFRVVVEAGGNSPTDTMLMVGIRVAFPVAFAGLALYTISYLIAYRPEKNLRAAGARATERAWQERRRLARSQAAAIDDALGPFREFKSTLVDAISPALDTLKSGLESTQRAAAEQLAELRRSVTSVDEAVQQVGQSVGQLITATGRIDKLLVGIPPILEGLGQLEGRQAELLSQLGQATADTRAEFLHTQQVWGTVLGSLQQLVTDLERLPLRVEASTRASLDTVAEKVPLIFVKGSEQLHETVVGIARQLESQVAASSGSLKGAADDLRDVVESSQKILATSVDRALERATATATRELPKLDEVFSVRFPDSLSRFEQLATQLGALATRLDDLHGAYTRLSERLEELARTETRSKEFDLLRQALSTMQKEISGIAKSTSEAAEVLMRLGGDGAQRRSKSWFPFDDAVARLRDALLRR